VKAKCKFDNSGFFREIEIDGEVCTDANLPLSIVGTEMVGSKLPQSFDIAVGSNITCTCPLYVEEPWRGLG